MTTEVNVTKTCSRCCTEKRLSEFYVNSRYVGGYSRRCKECVKAAARETAERNPARRREIRLNWNARNRKQKSASAAARRERKLLEVGDALLEAERNRVKQWRDRNPSAAAAIQSRAYHKRCNQRPEAEKTRRALAKQRMLDNPTRNIAYRLSGTVRSAIRKRSVAKVSRTVELLGCTVPEFMTHIAKQFEPGMSWDNWGQDTWHLDHIRPVSSFDLTKVDQQQACFHFTNYQPLWAPDNIRKGARFMPSVNQTETSQTTNLGERND